MIVRVSFLTMVLCLVAGDQAWGQFGVAMRMPNNLGFDATLRKTLTAELHFLRKVCDPTDEQFEEIHRAGIAAAKELSEHFGGNAARAKVRRVVTRPTSLPDPNDLVGMKLHEAVDRIMPADVSKKYLSEIAARVDARRAASAAMMVRLIDNEALLDPNQCHEVEITLQQIWSSDCSNSQLILMYPMYAKLPTSDVLVLHLSKLQQKLWAYRPNQRNVRLSWEMQFGVSNMLGIEDLKPFLEPGVAVAGGSK